MPRRPTNNASRSTVDSTEGTLVGEAIDGSSSSSTGSRQGRSKRLSRFVFTLNNYTAEDEAAIQQTCVDKNLKWLVYGHEVAPTTGTKHLQGACVVGKQVAFSAIKKWPGFEKTAIFEMKGSPSQCMDYCTKEDATNFFLHGEAPKPGKRNDILDMVETLKNGVTVKDAVLEDSNLAAVYVKYSSGFHRLENLLTSNRQRELQVVWIHGPSGSGKTRLACELSTKLFGEEGWWMSSGSLQWFDGYSRHKCVILDELRFEHVKYEYLLRLLDRYPVTVPIKGGTVPWVPTLIFVTSPFSPEDTYKNYGEEVKQLLRRITLVAEAPDGLKGVSALLCPEDQTLVVPMLPGGADDGGDDDGGALGDGNLIQLLLNSDEESYDLDEI